MIKKLFGGLKMSWPRVILFALIAGAFTALMALVAPNGSSFRQIAVNAEAWVLFAILIITNCDKPLEAACKTFVFFLISQPLVYLIQVPFQADGWQIFRYYPYWFIITLLTFPGAFLGWYIKRDDFWAGLILSVMLVLLIWHGVQYLRNLILYFPNYLISVLFCFALVPLLIFGIFRKKSAILTALGVSLAALLATLFLTFGQGPTERMAANIPEANELGLDESWSVRVSDESLSPGEIRANPTGRYELFMHFYDFGENTVTLTDAEGNEHAFVISFDEETHIDVRALDADAVPVTESRPS